MFIGRDVRGTQATRRRVVLKLEPVGNTVDDAERIDPAHRVVGLLVLGHGRHFRVGANTREVNAQELIERDRHGQHDTGHLKCVGYGIHVRIDDEYQVMNQIGPVVESDLVDDRVDHETHECYEATDAQIGQEYICCRSHLWVYEY